MTLRHGFGNVDVLASDGDCARHASDGAIKLIQILTATSLPQAPLFRGPVGCSRIANHTCFFEFPLILVFAARNLNPLRLPVSPPVRVPVGQ